MNELEQIVQRMIDANEPEEAIAAVIKEYNSNKKTEEGKTSTTEEDTTVDVDAVSNDPWLQFQQDMGSPSVDGSLDSQENNNEEGEFTYGDQRDLEQQIIDYKQLSKDILNGTGNYSGEEFKKYTKKDRENIIKNIPEPKYVEVKISELNDLEEYVFTPQAQKEINKTVAKSQEKYNKNLSQLEEGLTTKQIRQQRASTLFSDLYENDPFLKTVVYPEITKAAEPKILQAREAYTKKYNLNANSTSQDILNANNDFQEEVDFILEQTALDNKNFVNIRDGLSDIASSIVDEDMAAAGLKTARAELEFKIPFTDITLYKGISDYSFIEGLQQFGKQATGDMYGLELMGESTYSKNLVKEISAIKEKIESGQITENDQVDYEVTMSKKSNTLIGKKTGTAKQAIEYLQSKLTKQTGEQFDTLVDIDQIEKDLSIFNKVEIFDKDGVTWRDLGQLSGSQLPQMGLAMVAYGVGASAQMTASTYINNLDIIAKKEFSIPDGVQPTYEQLLEVINSDKDQQALALAVGTVGGQLERISAKGLFKPDIGKAVGSLVRGETRLLLQSAKKTGKRMIEGGLAEAVTETLQTGGEQMAGIIVGDGSGTFDFKGLKEAAGQGGIMGALIPGGMGVMRQSSVEFKQAAMKSAAALGMDNSYAKLEQHFKDLELNITKANFLSEKDKRERVLALGQIRNTVGKLSKDLNADQREEVLDLLITKQNINSKFQDVAPELIPKSAKDAIEKINNDISSIAETAYITSTVDMAMKEGLGENMFSANTTAEADALAADNDMSMVDSEGQRSEGAFSADGKTVIIDLEQAKKVGAFNVAGHELLHRVLFNTLYKEVDGKLVGSDVARSLGLELDKQLDKINPSILKNAYLKSRLELYKNEGKSMLAEEKLTILSDALRLGAITIDETGIDKFNSYFRRLFQNLGWKKIKFKDGKSVVNFIQDYNKSLDKGALGKSIKQGAEEGFEVVRGKDGIKKLKDDFEVIVKQSRSEDASNKLSKITIGEQLEAVLPEGMTNEEYKENGWKSVLAEVMTTDVLDGVIRNELKRRDIDTSGLDANVFGQPIEDFVEDVKGSAELQNTIKRWDGRGTIGGFIITELQKFRIGDVSNKLKNKPQTQSIEGNIKAQNVIVEEDSSGGIVDDKLPKMPSETTKYQNALVDNLGIKESEINAALDKVIKEAYTDKKIVTFGDTRVLPKSVADFYGKMFGINPQTLTDKTRNFQKYDAEGLTRAKQYLIANAPGDYSRLPKTKTDSNKGTFIPRKVTESLYTDGKLTGSLKDYMNLIKEKPVKPIYRDKVSQTIRGLLGVNIRNRVFETVVPSQGQRLIGGAKFSLSTKQDLANYKNIAELKVNNDAEGQPLFRPSNIKLVRKAIMKIFGVDYVNKKDTGKAYSTRNRNAKLPENIANKQGETFIEGSTRVVGDFLNQNPKWRNALRASTTAGVERGLFTTTKVFEKLFPIKKGVKQEGIRYGYTGKGKVLSEKFANSTKEKDFVENQYKQIDNLIDFFSDVETYLKKNPKDAWVFDAIVKDAQDNQNSIFRSSAPILFLATDSKGKLLFNVPLRQEHSMPQNNVSTMLLDMAINGRVKQDSKVIKATYMQGGLTMADDGLLDVDYKFTMPEVYWNEVFPRILSGDLKLPNGLAAVIRMTESGVNLDNLKYLVTGKSISEFFFDTKGVPVEMQKELISDYFTGKKDLKLIKDIAAKRVLINPSQIKASKSNNDKSAFKYSKTPTNKTTIETAATTDKALNVARDLDAPVKKIRVFDFDDTLAQTKSDVLYTMPDGAEGKLNAEQFANDGSTLLSEGAVFDFSEFNKVTEGKKGPLFKVAQTIAAKRGTEDVFVLTARAPESQLAIYEFLKSQGLDIPLKNITGLGDSTGDAKARWIVDKAADGYNDFYFADDAPQNVKAVRSALSVLDVKSKTQQAKIKFSKSLDLNKDFNDIIENKTGIASDKTYARVKAEVAGANKGKFNFFIPPSAEDFVGLLYSTLGKGSTGDAQMAWYKAHLLNPFARAMENVANDRAAMMQDFRGLKKALKIVPKDLRRKIPGEPFTKEQAVRAYIWDKQGMNIPGLSQKDQKDLVDYIKNDSELIVFADQLIDINKGDAYAAPDDGWIAGTIDTDFLKALNTTKRSKYLEVWQQNVDQIFSETNLNKLEAAYGKPYRVAMENILHRMETGRNRSFGTDTITGRFTDWLTNSVGAIMFFNTRSAVLQTISAVNFINFSDNNPLKAGQAFANQPQYWSDFKKLFNSPFLLDRRSGIKLNVNEADIAEMAKGPGNSARNVIAGLLKIGFLPTQLADSFAIASGGASFYRNRIKALKKEGLTDAEAEETAFRDFREIAEESQQSSRPDKISQQQAGPLGRIVLAFANTPAQYARLIKKAASDLKNRRGDAKTNISKIIYYGVAQNILFSALQQALFAISFGDEDDEEEKRNEKYFNIANGMSDSILRGIGVGGAIASVVKNTAIRLAKEADKKAPKYQDAVVKGVLQISPPISSKVGKLQSAGRSLSWNKKEMMTKGWAIDNPAYLASANVISAITNVPLDRAVKKVTNLVDASNEETEYYKRIALALGWSAWELDIEKEKFKKSKPKSKPKRKRTSSTKRRK